VKITIQKSGDCKDCVKYDKANNGVKCKLCLIADYPPDHPDRIKTEKEIKNGK
jgi:hypothetical protein